LGNPLQVGVGGEGETIGVPMAGEDHWPAGGGREVPAQVGDRRQGRLFDVRNRKWWQLPSSVVLQMAFSKAHQFDHPLVGLFGCCAEREDPVVHQNHAHRFITGFGGKSFGAKPAASMVASSQPLPLT